MNQFENGDLPLSMEAGGPQTPLPSTGSYSVESLSQLAESDGGEGESLSTGHDKIISFPERKLEVSPLLALPSRKIVYRTEQEQEQLTERVSKEKQFSSASSTHQSIGSKGESYELSAKVSSYDWPYPKRYRGALELLHWAALQYVYLSGKFPQLLILSPELASSLAEDVRKIYREVFEYSVPFVCEQKILRVPVYFDSKVSKDSVICVEYTSISAK